MNDWLRETITGLANEAGAAVPDMTDAEAEALLDIARIASHTSGDRTNAPLLCYLIGLIRKDAPDTPIETLKARVAARAKESGSNQ